MNLNKLKDIIIKQSVPLVIIASCAMVSLGTAKQLFSLTTIWDLNLVFQISILTLIGLFFFSCIPLPMVIDIIGSIRQHKIVEQNYRD